MIDTITYILASLILAVMVAVPMILFGAPTWAWFGLGSAVYLLYTPPYPR